jgi:hypothetical protein
MRTMSAKRKRVTTDAAAKTDQGDTLAMRSLRDPAGAIDEVALHRCLYALEQAATRIWAQLGVLAESLEGESLEGEDSPARFLVRFIAEEANAHMGELADLALTLEPDSDYSEPAKEARE